MSFKNFIRDIQELKGGIGSISRRSFEVRLSQPQQQPHHRSRSSSLASVGGDPAAPPDHRNEMSRQSCWANMPPELLRDIIQRLESSDNVWPSRKNVVACAAVCSTWREITKELVKSPELSGKLTFPVSLKQPGPRDATVQCYIERDRTTATYRLFLGLTPTLTENGKFLLAARKSRRATSTDYIISIDPEDMSRGSSSCVGKLRSNFLGTKFAIYDTQPPHSGAIASTNRAGRRVAAKQVSPKVPAGSYNVAHISYELNVLGTRGPRRMQCTLRCPATTPTTPPPSPSCPQSPAPQPRWPTTPSASPGDPLVLKNKSPRWHDQLQCWCLNFRGRVTVASVKNFQLVAAADQPPAPVCQGEQDKVLLQFGKIGKDMFTMDYRYPLSAFQAFAICLSSFDTKLACE
ncbi:tubby-like F-box protein 6 isoform X2 [Selaginella moellendorffii]|uniref:tubby-like F-box protein 6 isoform X2 n=1 Tax=Selaginella moellendorffii TaxID=88036 RepID=UPI000D1C5EB9|nr:tubby-like F-box protein 6 isoform X2 [Selaginella moellendorffii]|eukprot:XP_024524720.1 tubby-like F-box protein 6 isoform X2 [Selaginella moellendorffii]